MKALTHIESINNEVASMPATTSASVTPAEVISTLSQLKGLLISALSFAKIFTNSATDAKIDSVIAWLNSLPVAPAA